MTIYVVLPNGNTINLTVDMNDNIAHVKQLIFEATNIPVYQQILTFYGEIPADDMTLAGLNVNDARNRFELSVRSISECPVTGYQTVDLCVPVHIKPSATTGEVITRCCGNPIITPGIDPDGCPGTPAADCGFTIRQQICVEVPVEFSAETSTGTANVLCGTASTSNLCANCRTGPDTAE